MTNGHCRGALSRELREYLHAEVDRRTRERLRRVERIFAGGYTHCLGCDMPRAEWTPGCNRCSERHHSSHRRGSYPGGTEAFVLARRLATGYVAPTQALDST